MNKKIATMVSEKGHNIESEEGLLSAISDCEAILENYETRLLLDHQEYEAIYDNITTGLKNLYESGLIDKKEHRLLKVLIYVGNKQTVPVAKIKLNRIKTIVSTYPEEYQKGPINTVQEIIDSIDLIDKKCRDYFDHLGGIQKEGYYRRKLVKLKKKRERKE